MELILSSRAPETLVSSINLPSSNSSHHHTPAFLERRFLGSRNHLLRRAGFVQYCQKNSRKYGFQYKSPHSTLHEIVGFDSVFLFSAVVATIAALRLVEVIDWNAKRRGVVFQFSDKELSDILGSFKLLKQGADITEDGGFGCSLVSLLKGDRNTMTGNHNRFFEEGDLDFNDAIFLKHQGSSESPESCSYEIHWNSHHKSTIDVTHNGSTGSADKVYAEAAELQRDTKLALDTICVGELLGVRRNGLHKHHKNEFRSGNCCQLSHSAMVSKASAKAIPPASEYTNRRFPVASFQGSPGRYRQSVITHSFTKDIGQSIAYTSSTMQPSIKAFPNGNITDVRPAYARAYNQLLQDSRLSDCTDILEEMQRKGILDMEKISHSKFLKACKDQKAVKDAFRFVKLIKNPTISTFNVLLNVCAHAQDFEGAFEVMLLVKEAGLLPDCKLYTTLISTCGKSGKVDAMFEVFHEMVNAGVEPTVNTYGSLIDGCARAGQVAKAFGAYGIMSSKKVQPDGVIFNALISACGQSGAFDRAFDVLAEMMAEPKPIQPDHVTVGALMKTCIQAGQADRVPEVYEMLDKYKIKGTTDVYTIAVSSCSQTRDLNFAFRIYKDMTSKGILPDEMFLSTLIDVAGHAGNTESAFEILQNAKRKGMSLGNVAYSSLMGACCNAKDWQKAVKLYESIKAIKLLPTVSTLNALVTVLCESDQLVKSIEVLHEMKEIGVQPNIITYSVLLVACEKKHEAEFGVSLFQEAKGDGVLPNLIMCRCLTGLCLWSFEKTKLLGDSIVSFNGGRPHIDSQWTSRAITTYRETISAGVIPSIEVFSQVLGCLKFPNDAILRGRFIENLGISLDASRKLNISSLLDGFGEYDIRSFSVLEEAVSLGVIPRVSFKESPVTIDARKLQIHTVEVYILTILKGLKHRLAAGARLPNIIILLPTEKKRITSDKAERTINLVGRVGQAVGSLLRRLGLPYHGDESYGKIRINGLTLRRWFKPNLDGPSLGGRPTRMYPIEARLGKGIADQQRSIRSSNYLFP